MMSMKNALACMFFTLGILVLVCLLSVIVAAWHTIVVASSLLVWVIFAATCLSLTGGSLWLFSMGVRALGLTVFTLVEKRQALRHANEKHELDQHLALSRLQADALGNYPILLKSSEQAVNAMAFAPGNSPVKPVRIKEVPAPLLPLPAAGQAEPRLPRPHPVLALPERVLMVDILRTWDLSRDNLLLGLGKGGQPLACSLEGFMHVAHDAATGLGKTSQSYGEIVMLLKLGVQIIVANPHFAPVDKKGRDWRPIAQAIEAQGRLHLAPGATCSGLLRNVDDIARMLAWLSIQEIDRRLALQLAGDFRYQPIYLFVDEWPGIVQRHPEAADYLMDIVQRGRAVEVCVQTNAHGFVSKDVNLQGSAPENFSTAYHMGGSPYSAAKLLDMPVKDIHALLKSEEVTLGKGVALLRNNEACPQAQLVRLPYADNEFAYYLLGRADRWVPSELRRYDSDTAITGSVVDQEETPQDI
jgi:hypothetical protein